MTMRILTLASRILVGIVFIFSGFVKAVDPLGSTYKFTDYFEAFGLASLEPIAFPLAIFLSSLEFFLGFLMIFGTWMKLATWLNLLFMAYFTPLTLWLAITNPVTDCGCFGDALILTNWETFYKNLILLVPTIYLFNLRKKLNSSLQPIPRFASALIPLLFILWVNLDAYRHLPMFDFRPYKIGTHILSGMEYPENAERDQYEIITVYSKDGIEQEFDLMNLPDSTWTWVRTDNKLIKKGYEPPIHDFVLESVDGIDMTDYYLNRKGLTFMLISHDLSKSSIENQQKINELADFALYKGAEFIGVTSSLSESEEYAMNHEIHYPYFGMDEITLKTIIRANPGLVVLYDGVIIGKYHWRDIPQDADLKGDMLSWFLNDQKEKSNRASQWMLYFLGIGFLALVYCMELMLRKKSA